MKKTKVYLISSERIVDKSRAEGDRSTVINCHAMIGSQIDDVIQKDEKLNNTEKKMKQQFFPALIYHGGGGVKCKLSLNAFLRLIVYFSVIVIRVR